MASPGNDRQEAKEAKDAKDIENPRKRPRTLASITNPQPPYAAVMDGIFKPEFVLRSLARMIARSKCRLTGLRVIPAAGWSETGKFSCYSTFHPFMQRLHRKYPDPTEIPQVTPDNIQPAAGGPFAFLLHGTPKENFQSIITGGLDPREIRYGSHFFFSTDPEACRWHTGYKIDSGDAEFDLLLFVSVSQPSPDPVLRDVWTVSAVDFTSLLVVGIVRLKHV